MQIVIQQVWGGGLRLLVLTSSQEVLSLTWGLYSEKPGSIGFSECNFWCTHSIHHFTASVMDTEKKILLSSLLIVWQE